MYQYKALVVRCVDGDTAVLLVDVGFKMYVEMAFRLLGINAPEIKGVTKEAGKSAKAYLEALIDKKEVIIRTEKDDKYGRYLAKIEINGLDVNAEMIQAGHAVPYLV